MPPPPKALTTLSDLVRKYGRDVRYWSGYVDGMDLPTYRDKHNAKAIDAAGLKQIEERHAQATPAEAR